MVKVFQVVRGITVSLTATANPLKSFTPELTIAAPSVASESFNSIAAAFMITFIPNNKTSREEPNRHYSHLSLRRHYPVQVVRV
jgi:hypothetical protein